MEQTPEELYLNGIIIELERNRLAGKKHLYRINEKYTPEMLSLVDRYFKDNSSYVFEKRICQSCLHTWDLIITII